MEPPTFLTGLYAPSPHLRLTTFQVVVPGIGKIHEESRNVNEPLLLVKSSLFLWHTLKPFLFPQLVVRRRGFLGIVDLDSGQLAALTHVLTSTDDLEDPGAERFEDILREDAFAQQTRRPTLIHCEGRLDAGQHAVDLLAQLQNENGPHSIHKFVIDVTACNAIAGNRVCGGER